MSVIVHLFEEVGFPISEHHVDSCVHLVVRHVTIFTDSLMLRTFRLSLLYVFVKRAEELMSTSLKEAE